MPTRTGDATADLIALLREHCPEVAEETSSGSPLPRRHFESVGGPPDLGSEEARLRWAKLTLGDLPGVKQLVSTAEAPVQVIAALSSSSPGSSTSSRRSCSPSRIRTGR